MRLPPGGTSIRAAEILDAIRGDEPGETLRAELRQGLAAEDITLHASGREAMRVAFRAVAETTGRDEVAIPAYTCFSVPAAAVAAGLRVRLLDVDLQGRVDLESLEKMPCESVAAVVVTNLFGVPEATSPFRVHLDGTGVRLIDDAAQALGSSTAEGRAGGRGDIGILSFGRGKPLSALGGGACVWNDHESHSALPAPQGGRAGAVARAIAYNLALLPAVFGSLAAIPALGIGTTVYEPDFDRGAIAGPSARLADALVSGVTSAGRRRAAEAAALGARLKAETRFEPLLADSPEAGVYPRLGVVAPSREAREQALEALRHLGVTSMYPTSLDQLGPLQPHLVGKAARTGMPGAGELAARLITVPSHGVLRGNRLEELFRVLRSAS